VAQTQNSKTIKKWLRALSIAKILFEDEGYFTDYLNQIEAYITNKRQGAGVNEETLSQSR